MMSVSEPLAAERPLPSVTRWHRPSTRFAEKRRAAWKVVFWDCKSGITHSTVDWLCPQCEQAIHSDHTNSRRCPRCGLMVGETPVFRESLPRSIRNKEWNRWAQELFFGDEEKNDEQGRGAVGVATKHPLHPGQRPGKAAQRHRHQSSTVSKSQSHTR